MHLTRADFQKGGQFDTAAMSKASVTTDDLTKAGARKNKDDAAKIQSMHDIMAELSNGQTCNEAKPGFTTELDDDATNKAAAGDLEKKGARHSAVDMATMKVAHDAMCALGATCGKAADDKADKAAPPKDGDDLDKAKKPADDKKAEGEDGA